MNKETFEQILALNANFYQQVASDFADSRQYPWKGWGRVVAFFLTPAPGETRHRVRPDTLRVLDLGCGNGRFYTYLQNELPNYEIDYLGLDTNKKLLELGQGETRGRVRPGSGYEEMDVITKVAEIAPKHGKFDLVVAFGLTHHIPSAEYRKSWVEEVAKLVNKDGKLVLTFWNFDKSKAVTTPENIDTKELEAGDYFLSWDKKPNVYRYCHRFDEKELTQIKNLVEANGGKLFETFDEDKFNKYLVFCF